MNELREAILRELKIKKSMTFNELCKLGTSLGFTDWDVATTLPALCKEGYLEKVTRKVKKRKFLTTVEETETRYYLR